MPHDPADLDWLLKIAGKCDYFKLLAIDRNVDDPTHLRSAARAQADRLAPFQTGPHAERAGQILKRIGRAYRTLADSDKRAEYLTKLAASKRSSRPASAVENLFQDSTALPSPADPAELFVTPPLADNAPPNRSDDIDFSSIAGRPPRPGHSRSTGWVTITSVMFILINGAILGYWWAYIRKDDQVELRRAREAALDRRQPQPPTTNTPPANPLPPPEDPNLQPNAFR
jgi:hypothetical protein